MVGSISISVGYCCLGVGCLVLCCGSSRDGLFGLEGVRVDLFDLVGCCWCLDDVVVEYLEVRRD